MSIKVSYQPTCDRCQEPIGEPLDHDPLDDNEDRSSLLSIEAEAFGVSLKTMNDMCDSCKKVMPELLDQVVSATTKTKDQAAGGES